MFCRYHHPYKLESRTIRKALHRPRPCSKYTQGVIGIRPGVYSVHYKQKPLPSSFVTTTNNPLLRESFKSPQLLDDATTFTPQIVPVSPDEKRNNSCVQKPSIRLATNRKQIQEYFDALERNKRLYNFSDTGENDVTKCSSVGNLDEHSTKGESARASIHPGPEQLNSAAKVIDKPKGIKHNTCNSKKGCYKCPSDMEFCSKLHNLKSANVRQPKVDQDEHLTTENLTGSETESQPPTMAPSTSSIPVPSYQSVQESKLPSTKSSRQDPSTVDGVATASSSSIRQDPPPTDVPTFTCDQDAGQTRLIIHQGRSGEFANCTDDRRSGLNTLIVGLSYNLNHYLRIKAKMLTTDEELNMLRTRSKQYAENNFDSIPLSQLVEDILRMIGHGVPSIDASVNYRETDVLDDSGKGRRRRKK